MVAETCTLCAGRGKLLPTHFSSMVFFILAIDYFDNSSFCYVGKHIASDYREFETVELAKRYAETFYPNKKYKIFQVKEV